MIAHIVVNRAAPGTRVVDFAKAHLAVVPSDAVGPLIATGAMTLDDRVAKIADPVRDGDVLAIALAALPTDALVPEPMTLPIAYEDDDVIVIDKPAGMHVHPIGAFRTGTAVNALLAHAGAGADQPWAAWRPHPAHRLDRATSGLVAFAKHAAIHDAMRALFDAGRVERRYRATVRGVIGTDAGTIDAPLGRDPALPYRQAVVAGGDPAITHYRVIARDSATTIVELVLETGRTHQIRAHLASLGHPVVGDTLYETGARSSASGAEIRLRAFGLAFPHPRDGRELQIVTGS